MSDRVNPDCEVGKHPACNEDAWDDVTDRPTVCECACHEPDQEPSASETKRPPMPGGSLLGAILAGQERMRETAIERSPHRKHEPTEGQENR